MLTTTRTPPVFVSHGSPMTAIDPGAAGRFMRALGPAIDATSGRPKAIVAISAHTMTREPVVLGAAQHEAIYDFGGFDPKLYTLRYDAPGSPVIAQRVQALLEAAGIAVHRVDEGGLDHGIWTPLRYAYPEADVPIVPLAWVPTWSPERQMALGAALAPLADEGVLLLGSGSITHNLRLFMQGRPGIDAPEAPESAAFRTWFAESAARPDWDALSNYRHRAPYAVAMHPSDEHLLPWYVTAGAGGREHTPQRVHDSAAYSFIGMDAYAFGPGASALASELDRRLA